MKISLFKFVWLGTLIIAILYSCQDPNTCGNAKCEKVLPPTDNTCDLALKSTTVIPTQDILYISRIDPETDSIRQEGRDINLEEYRKKFLEAWDIKDPNNQFDMDKTIITLPCECDKGLLLFDYSQTNSPGFEERHETAESSAGEEETGSSSKNKIFNIGSYANLQPSLDINEEAPLEQDPKYKAKNPVEVGVIDSGIDVWGNTFSKNHWQTDNPFCLNIELAGYDFATPNPLPHDLNGHGSHVAGIIKGAKISNSDVTAPPDESLRIMSLKISSKSVIDLADAVCAISFAAQSGIEIINLSWGYYSKEIDEVLYRVIADYPEILFVTSAGNNSLDTDECLHWPSNLSKELDHVLSVGALNEAQDNISIFSNYGDETVNILAPGTNIISNFPIDCCACKHGTSMAAAYVSRLAAWHKFKDQTLKGSKLKKAILSDNALQLVTDVNPSASNIPLIDGKMLRGDNKVCQ